MSIYPTDISNFLDYDQNHDDKIMGKISNQKTNYN